MAESAKNIYDEPGNEPVERPQLEALEGGGETSPPDHSWYKGDKEPDAKSLDKAESDGDGNGQVGEGYTGEGEPTGLRRHFTADRKRAGIIFGGAAAIMAMLSISIFLILLPAKIYSIVQNMQRIFFSSSENAVKKMEQQELSAYVRKVIFPGLGRNIAGVSCPRSTLAKIDRRCFVVQDKGMFGNLFTAWKQGNLENRLAQDGMEFQKIGNNLNAKLNLNLDGVGTVDVTDVATKNINLVDSVGWKQFPSTNEFKAAISNHIDEHMQHASYYKKTMYRYKVARLLETKYGIKMCIIACDSRRDFSDWKNKKVAAGIIRAQRLLAPRSDMVTFVLTCILSTGLGTPDPQCDVLTHQADPAEQPKIDENGCEIHCIDNGESKSAAEKKIQHDIEALAGKYALKTAEDIARATDLYNSFTRFGFTGTILRTIIREAILSAGGSGADAKKIDAKVGAALDKLKVANPAISGLQMAAILVTSIDEMAKIIPTMAYLDQTKTLVQSFAVYRTLTDECKTGNCDPAIFGSFISSLGQGKQDPTGKNSNDIGGLAEAEHTPLYSMLLGDKSGLGASDYTCARDANGKELPPDTSKSPVCKEERLDSRPRADLSGVRSLPVWGAIASAASAFNNLTTAVQSWVLGKLCDIISPICDELNSLVSYIINQVASYLKLYKFLGDFFQNYLLPIPPVGSLQSGGRTFDMIAGGADVSGNDFAQHSLGGVVLNTRQVAEIRTDQNNSELQRYNSQSFFAKMFDQDHKDSLISQVALAIPSKPTEAARTSIASLINNPFSKILHSFATIFSLRPHLVDAATTTSKCASELMTSDPFCVTQYGYPQDDPIFQKDPQQYWNNNCIDATAQTNILGWNQAASAYADKGGDNGTIHVAQNLQGGGGFTGFDSSGTNPCLLIIAAAGAGGGAFDDSLLTPDERNGANSGTTSGGGGGPINCSAYSQDPTTWVDQSAGDPGPYKSFVIQAAPNRECSGSLYPKFQTPPSAIPNDPTKQYFAACTNNNTCTPMTITDQSGFKSSCQGGSFVGSGPYIGVKFRDPPGSGNTICVPVFVVVGSGGGTGVCTLLPSGQYRWVGGPKAGQLCP